MKISGGALTSRLKKLNRHFSTIAPHLTFKKLLNALRMEFHFKMGHTFVKGFPYWIKIETSRVCNLSCPGCYAHGDDIDPAYSGMENEKRFMPLALFKQILDQVKEYAVAVQLYDEGEPMLNPDIYDIVAYANRCNVGSVISSNFSMPFKDGDFDKLVQAGLDRMVICIDGVTQEIYEKTRVNGNLERVISNSRKLLDARKKSGRKRPLVEIQFIQKPFNIHEQPAVESLAAQLGADMFTPIRLGAFWASVAPTPPPPPRKCPIPWSGLVSQWNGDISVCPLSDSPDLVTSDNAKNSPLQTIYNSDFYLALRRQHADMNRAPVEDARAPICLLCDFKR